MRWALSPSLPPRIETLLTGLVRPAFGRRRGAPDRVNAAGDRRCGEPDPEATGANKPRLRAQKLYLLGVKPVFTLRDVFPLPVLGAHCLPSEGVLDREPSRGKKKLWNPQSKELRSLLGDPVESGGELSLRAGEMILVSGKISDGTRRLIELLGTPNQWTQGQVCYHGTNLAGLSNEQKWRFRRSCPFVYARNHLHGGLSVQENVTEGIGGKKSTEESVESALACMELGQWATRRGPIWTPQFEQRVAWARALAMQSPALVAEDAWGYLSRRLQRRLFGELYRRSLRGACVVLVSTTWPVTLAPEQLRWIALREGKVHFDELISRRDPAVQTAHDRAHLTWAEHAKSPPPPPPPLSPRAVKRAKLKKPATPLHLSSTRSPVSDEQSSRPELQRPDMFRKRA